MYYGTAVGNNPRESLHVHLLCVHVWELLRNFVYTIINVEKR